MIRDFKVCPRLYCRIFRLFLLLLTFSVAGFQLHAFSILIVEEYVRPDFTVQVLDWKHRPIPNADVLLIPFPVGGEASPAAENSAVKTDQQGVVRFENIRAGRYQLRLDKRNAVSRLLNVVPQPETLPMVAQFPESHPIRTSIELVWPMNVMAIQQATGRVNAGDSHTFRITLIEGDSGKRLKSTKTDASGRFRFANVAPGLFFLSVSNLDRSDLSELALEIDPTAPAKRIDLDLRRRKGKVPVL